MSCKLLLKIFRHGAKVARFSVILKQCNSYYCIMAIIIIKCVFELNYCKHIYGCVVCNFIALFIPVCAIMHIVADCFQLAFQLFEVCKQTHKIMQTC